LTNENGQTFRSLMHKLEHIDTARVVKKPALAKNPKPPIQKKTEIIELDVISEDVL
jgi:hypothetical protein